MLEEDISSSVISRSEEYSPSFLTSRRLPSESEDEYDDVGDTAQADGVQLVQCSAELRQFASYVGVVFDGNEEDLDKCERRRLEQGFVSTYRFLAGQRCDGFFRTINDGDVKLNKRPAWLSRRLQGTNNGGVNATSNSVPYGSSFFEVNASCRNCPVTDSGKFGLFNDAFRRLMLVEAADTGNGYSNIVEGRDGYNSARNLEYYDTSYEDDDDDHYYKEPMDTCECPAGTAVEEGDDYYRKQPRPPSPDAPGIEEFRKAYNRYIEHLSESCSIYSISKVKTLEEFDSPPQRPYKL